MLWHCLEITTITLLSSMFYTKLLYPNFSNLLLYALVLVSLIFFFLFSTYSLLLGSSILQKWTHQSSFISLLMEGQDAKASSPSFSRPNIVVTIPQENVGRLWSNIHFQSSLLNTCKEKYWE
jgi:hypothetical protein